MAYTKTVWKDYPDTTTKMTAQKLNNIENGIEALDTGKVNISDIVDNLTSTSSVNALSANQGKVLNDGIEDLQELVVTNEIKPTNRYINGKRVYVKRIDMGVLPNATRKEVAHGLTDFSLVELKGSAYNASTGETLLIPFTWPAALTSQVGCLTTTTNVGVQTGNDRTAYSGFMDVYFTYND